MAGNGSRQRTYTGAPRRGPRGPVAARARLSKETQADRRTDPLPRPEGVPPPGSAIGPIPLHLILDWATGRNKETKGPRTESARHYSLKAHLVALREHLTLTTATELSSEMQHALDEYVRRRITHERRVKVKGPDGRIATVKASTAMGEWSTLGKLVREFAAEFGLVGVPKISVPLRGVAPVFSLERSMVARILWALRGRRWDRATDAWKLDEDATQRRPSWDRVACGWRVDPDAKQRLIVKVDGLAFLARLVLLLVYTGSTALCACDLAWEGHESEAQSFVDLFEEDVPIGEQGIIGLPGAGSADDGTSSVDLKDESAHEENWWKKKRFAGHLYRLGKHAAPGSKNGVGVRISRRLSAHLFRWRATDAREGHTGAIIRRRFRRGARFGPLRPIKVPNSRLLNDLWDWAGLPPEVDLGTLSDTCAIWVLRAGTKPRGGMKVWKRNAAMIRSAAFLTGRGYRHFASRFGTYDEDFQRRQTELLDDPVATVQGSLKESQGGGLRSAAAASRRRSSSDS